MIGPGALEASPVQTVVAGGHRLSFPALAISPSGRVAVAWFEQRDTEYEWSEDAVAVKVRERGTDGAWGPIRTVWRAPAKPVFGPEHLAVALDDSGDGAVLWTIEPERVANPKPVQLLVSTRRGSGEYGAPKTLDPKVAESDPAVAVTPGGEVAALWAGPWRSPAGALYSERWPAGSPPPGTPAPLDELPSAEAHGYGVPFGDLSLQSAGAGAELATWLRGEPGSGRPEPVSLRAAWRAPGANFEAPETVSSPGIEARDPVLELANQRHALLAWSEIAADGSGPRLNYATGPEGAQLAAGSPIAAKLNETGFPFGNTDLGATWLPGGRALLAWYSGEAELADELQPGSPPGPAVQIGSKLGSDGESAGNAAVAGSEAAAPVLAWFGRSPADFSTEALRYVIGANLPAFPRPPSPSASLTGTGAVALDGVQVRVACPQACAASLTGTAYALREEDAENAAARAYAPIGSLRAAQLSLAAGASGVVRLTLPRRTRGRFCGTAHGGQNEAVEVIVSITSPGGPAVRLVLGESPNTNGCR